MRFLQRPAAAVYNCKYNDSHHHVLRPATSDKVRAEAVKGQSDNGKRPRLHHRHRMQQRCYRRGSHACLGEPGIKWAYRRLHPEAAEGNHIYQQKKCPLITADYRRIKHASEGKINRGPIGQQENQPDKSKSSSAQGIIQVFPAGKNCLPCQRMEHQGHRHHGQKLIEEIHGEHILCKCNTQRNSIGDCIKHEKEPFPLFMLHIFKRIQCGKRP